MPRLNYPEHVAIHHFHSTSAPSMAAKVTQSVQRPILPNLNPMLMTKYPHRPLEHCIDDMTVAAPSSGHRPVDRFQAKHPAQPSKRVPSGVYHALKINIPPKDDSPWESLQKMATLKAEIPDLVGCTPFGLGRDFHYRHQRQPSIESASTGPPQPLRHYRNFKT